MAYNSKLIEQGNGLPDDGELVYHPDTDQLFRVVSTSGIQTDDPRGNYVFAEIEKDFSDLSEEEYENLTVSVVLDEEDANEEPLPSQIRALRQEAGEHGDMDMVAICDHALAGDQDAVDAVARVRSDARAADC